MKRLSIFLMLSMLVLTLGACALSQTSSVKDGTIQSKEPIPNQTFYGFADIPVPRELNLDNQRSFIYETTTLRVGVIVLSGNVDMDSLETYFKVNMAKNGWRFVNSFKFKDIALNFIKDDRTCNIRMSRDSFTTEVEIWVGPSTSFENKTAIPLKGSNVK